MSTDNSSPKPNNTQNGHQTQLSFDLVEKVQIGNKLQDNKKIKFSYDEDKDNVSLTNITITIDSDEQENDAYHNVRTILDLIGVQLGRYIDHKCPEKTTVKDDGKMERTKNFTIGVTLAPKTCDIDLSNSKIEKLLTNQNNQLHQQLYDLMTGIKAYDNQNYVEAIRSIWLSIENTEWKKSCYDKLRHGISHTGLCDTVTIHVLKELFKLKLGEYSQRNKEKDSQPTKKIKYYVDKNDPENKKNIKKYAGCLKEIAIKEIIDKISKEIKN